MNKRELKKKGDLTRKNVIKKKRNDNRGTNND